MAGIGLEPTLGEWVQNIVAVMREVWRVLRDDGTVWLNLGDAYAGSGKGAHANPGLSKSFSRNAKFTDGTPGEHHGPAWRVALAYRMTAGYWLAHCLAQVKSDAGAPDRPTSYELSV